MFLGSVTGQGLGETHGVRSIFRSPLWTLARYDAILATGRKFVQSEMICLVAILSLFAMKLDNLVLDIQDVLRISGRTQRRLGIQQLWYLVEWFTGMFVRICRLGATSGLLSSPPRLPFQGLWSCQKLHNIDIRICVS